MIFEEALTDIANRFNFDPDTLIQYSYEDEISGWDKGVGGWPVGSLWTVEGRVLYALVRALKPGRVIEIGTNVGCSTSHIASALKANGRGHLITFDTEENVTIPPDENGHSAVYRAGELIPPELMEYVEILNGDGIQFLELDLSSADFIYEDGDHSSDSVFRSWKAGVPKLNPGGVMISHDAAHWLVGEATQKGIHEAGYNPAVYLIRPSDCGLAVWRAPEGVIEKPKRETVALSDLLQPFVPEVNNEPDALNAMSQKELISYARKLNIVLGSARKKNEIIETIRGA